MSESYSIVGFQAKKRCRKRFFQISLNFLFKKWPPVDDTGVSLSFFMVFTIRSSALSGILGISVRVETDIASGFPAFQIVGLGDVAVQESRERVRSAIRNSGFSFPAKRITVNLAPADVRKTGPAFDLAIALAIIAEECGLSERAFKNMAVLGELALDGSLRGIGASVAHAVAVRESG